MNLFTLLIIINLAFRCGTCCTAHKDGPTTTTTTTNKATSTTITTTTLTTIESSNTEPKESTPMPTSTTEYTGPPILETVSKYSTNIKQKL